VTRGRNACAGGGRGRLRRRDALALLSLPLLGASCAKRVAAPAPRQPHIIILLVDALRQDFVGCYGGGADATPAIDRIAQEGVRFSNAYANAPWTLPSHASLFTGLAPEVHRQTHAAVEEKDGAICLKPEARLPGRLATMASILKERGYQTVGISQNPWVGALSTQDHGFDFFWELGRKTGLPFPEQQGDDLKVHKVTYFFRQFLAARRASARPLFLFVNYIACHLPYDPPELYRQKFVSGPAPRRLAEIESNNWLVRKERGELDANAAAALEELYRAEVAYADAAVAELRVELEAARLLDDALLVVTSDHGESLGQHGFFDHQFNLYDDLLRVPLIVRHAALPARGACESLVQLSDLLPTVLHFLGNDETRARFALGGVPLFDARGLAPIPERPLFFMFRRGSRVLATWKDAIAKEVFARLDRELFAVRDGAMKMIVASDGESELYDLGSDSSEAKKLIAPGKAAALRALLAARYAGAGVGFPGA
jgi:arylsulfatase A-like enzyme